MSKKLQEVDITNCDREPIHIIEQSQDHGVILITNVSSKKVIQASSNSSDLLGIDLDEIINQPLESILPSSEIDHLFNCIDDHKNLYPFKVSFLSKAYMVIPHLTDNKELIIDIEAAEGMVNPIQFQEELIKILKEISVKDTLNQMCLQTAMLVKDLYQYDRVMIYRFDEEWNGEVVGEAKEKHLESWLGLHYPATDIPKPARDIFKKQGVRIISDVTYNPVPLLPPLDQKINLLRSELRAVSPIHIEYLKNMNVSASLTAAITLNNQLWGLIACHHSTKKFINYHQRQSCKFLAEVFANKLALKESNDFLENINQSEAIRKKLLLQLNNVDNLVTAVSKLNIKFTDLIECSGGAFYYNEKLVLVGNTPNESQVLDIIEEFLNPKTPSVFHTKSLVNYYEKANSFTKTASGLLSIRIGNENNYLIWFRPEFSTTVTWGGKPQKEGYIKDGVKYLHPRKSFEKWTENVSGIAKKWENYDIEAASNLVETITHTIVRQQKNQIDLLNESLVEINKELETFSYSVSHDLKAPLRGIDGYSRILLNSYAENLDDYGKNALQTILSSANEMNEFIEDLLHYSKVGQNKLTVSHFSTFNLVNSIIESQNIISENSKIQLKIDENLPPIVGDKRMITQVFANLISNAVKYSSKEENPKIEIGFKEENEQTVFFVKDNGIGFDQSQENKIFDVFSRVASSQHFSGSGIGLATVKKVIEKHNGKIWTKASEGNGATFFFYVDIIDK